MRSSRNFSAAVSALLLMLSNSALADWSQEPSTIKSTAFAIPKIGAVSDGAGGAVIAFQEEATGARFLRIQHVLETGVLDPAWPAEGAVLCSVSTARVSVGAVEDGAGGAFVWWLEGPQLYLSRITGTGLVAAGWPSRGRLLGTMATVHDRPDAIADGAGGVYIAWAQDVGEYYGFIRLIRIAADNTPPAGWSTDPIAPALHDYWSYWPTLAPAPNGGVYVGWYDSQFKVARLEADGSLSSEWPSPALTRGDVTLYWIELSSPRIRIKAYPDGGVLMFRVEGEYPAEARVHRFTSSGDDAPLWPAAGILASSYLNTFDFGPEIGFDLFPGPNGGAIAMLPYFSVHWPDQIVHDVGPQTSTQPSGFFGGNVEGSEAVPDGAGGLFVATYKPSFAMHPYTPDASLTFQMHHCPPDWEGITRYHDDTIRWYGDIDVVATGDGGAIFIWSQHHEALGLFAQRFSGAGEVVGVEPAEAVIRGMRAWFTTGSGVRVIGAFRDAAAARVDLFDVTGRRVSQADAASGTFDLVLPGTSELGAGLYFARMRVGDEVLNARVVVQR